MVILVILATISIDGLLGENGLITKARQQKEERNGQVEQEQIETEKKQNEYDDIMSDKGKTLEREWVTNVSGNGEDKFIDVIETSDGGYLAVGYSASTDLWFTNKGKSDAIIVKYDINGNMQWRDSIGGTGADWYSGAIENNGNYIVVGSICSPSVKTKTATLTVTTASGSKVTGSGIIVKYSKDGNEIFSKKYEGTVESSYASGNKLEYTLCNSVEKVSTGYIVVAKKGYLNTAGTGNRYQGPVLLQYNNSDGLQSEKEIGTKTNNNVTNTAISKYNDDEASWNALIGNLKNGDKSILYGKYSNTSGGTKSRIIRTTSAFTVEKEILHKTDLGTIGRDYCIATNVVLDASGNMIANLKDVGYENGGICKMDLNGNSSWIKEDGDYKSITKVNNERFSAIKKGNNNMKLVRYNMNGAKIQEHQIPDYDDVYRVGVDEKYIFLGSPTNEQGITIKGTSDAVIAKYTVVKVK